MADWNGLIAAVENVELVRPVGTVAAVQDGVLMLEGLSEQAGIGDHVTVQRNKTGPLQGEVICVDRRTVQMLPGAPADGVVVGNPVILRKQPDFAPSASWIGRVIDPFGRPLDGRPIVRGATAADLMSAAPPASERRLPGDRLDTGMSVLNTMLPIVKGQRIGLFAGSGVGKSRLLAHLAQHMQADIVVIALIGERGREVNEFVQTVLGPKGMERSVIVAATSDKSALERRRCAWAATCTAEFFRNQGLHVLFLVDSITRFAEAHREVAIATGEVPALRGYPASVMPMITSLCERAGPGTSAQGDITAIFNVLVAGSDMEEPVADILRGVLDGHFVLSRDIAERGRYPAIDVLKSVSRSLPMAATEDENEMIRDVRKLVSAYERSEVMIKAGLYNAGTDPVLDQAVQVWPELDEFFGRPDMDGVRNSFNRLALLLRRSRLPAKA